MTKQRPEKDADTAADPFETWRRLYEANEAIWSKAAKDTTNTEAFAQTQGKMLETFLAFQKTARDAMSAQLATMNLPSRDDVARLGELILGLEEKVDRLEDRLAAFAPARAGRTSAPQAGAGVRRRGAKVAPRGGRKS
jgi:polyhydroxyalkanoic acid synthase PhaR subunit